MSRGAVLRTVAVAGMLSLLSGCGELAGAVGRIGWLVLLPTVFIGLFLIALWLYKRTPPGRDDADERRYPDYRGDRDGD